MRKHLLAFISLIALTTCSGTVPAMAQSQLDEAVAEINGMDQALEHASVVFDDGSYSPIVTGGEYSVSVPLALSTVDPDRFKNIVGLIHSHPKTTTGDVSVDTLYDILNEQPSTADDNVGGGMCLFIAFAGSTSPHFDMIVIGPDDVARTYRYECE